MENDKPKCECAMDGCHAEGKWQTYRGLFCSDCALRKVQIAGNRAVAASIAAGNEVNIQPQWYYDRGHSTVCTLIGA